LRESEGLRDLSLSFCTCDVLVEPDTRTIPVSPQILSDFETGFFFFYRDFAKKKKKKKITTKKILCVLNVWNFFEKKN
jgi:hypothetical protein